MGLQRPWRAGLTSKLDQIAQDLVQSGFENLQEQRFLSLSGLPISGLNHLHWISPPYIQSQFLLLQSVTIASCPCTVYLWEEQLCLPCNCPLDSWWWQLDSSPKPLPKAKQTQSLSCSSYVTWSRHFTVPSQVYQYHFGDESPKLDAVFEVLPHKYKAGFSSISLLASCALANTTLHALSPHHRKETLPLPTHVEFAFHQYPLASFMNLFCPRCRTWVCLCWISQGSCWPIPVSCWGLSEWQPWPPAHELVSCIWCHLWTWWRCILSYCLGPGYWWRY